MSKIPVFLIRILIFTVLVLFFGMSENSFAAEQAFNLGPVSVISIYRPFYKNYVLFPETTETSAIDAGSALKDVPGLWEIRKGGIANDINLRGLHRDYINVLVDGIRIYGACPGRMDPPLFHESLNEISSITVIKGPFDITHQGSMGGAILIKTGEPKEGIHLTGSMSANNWGYRNPNAVISYNNGKFYFIGGYSYKISKPFEDGNGVSFTELLPATNKNAYKSQFYDSDAFNIKTYWGKIGFHPDPDKTIEISYSKQDGEGILYPTLMMDAVYDKSDQFSVRYKVGNITDAMKNLKIIAYYTDVFHFMTNGMRESNNISAPLGYTMGTLASTRTYGIHSSVNIYGNILGIGIHKRNWNAVSSGYMSAYNIYKYQNSIPDVFITNLGFYFKRNLKVSSRININIGFRLDRTNSMANQGLINALTMVKSDAAIYNMYYGGMSNSNTFTYPSGDVILNYRFDNNLNFFGGIGHTVSTPDPEELYFARWSPLAIGGLGNWVGNPNLNPTKNDEIDAGFKLNGQKFLSNFDVYYRHLTNYIALTEIDPNSSLLSARTYQNTDADMWGFEDSSTYRLIDNVDLKGTLSYVRGIQEIDLAKGIRSSDMYEIPPFRATLAAKYHKNAYFGEIEGVFAKTQNDVNSDINEFSTPGYGIMNIRGGYKYKGVNFYAGVDNVLDKQYYDYLSYFRDPFNAGVLVPEPGRTFYVNISYNF